MWLLWGSKRKLFWRRTNLKFEVEERVKNLKNRKAAGKDEVTEEMVKGVIWPLRVMLCLKT